MRLARKRVSGSSYPLVSRSSLSELRGGEFAVAPYLGCTARGRIEQHLRFRSVAFERECRAAQPFAVDFRPRGGVLLCIEQCFGAVEMGERVSGIPRLHVVT